MHDRFEPPTRPLPTLSPDYPPRAAADPFADLDWDPYYPAMVDAAADEARDLGLRRLSMLTLHATGLSVVTAIGLTTAFASTAHPHATTVVAAKPSPGAATATGTPSPGPTPTAHKKKRHHHAAASPAGATTAPAASAPAASAPAAAAAPASSPTLAPPTTAPAAAPPSPAPTQTTSSGSVPA
jgi:hypothetical protein